MNRRELLASAGVSAGTVMTTGCLDGSGMPDEPDADDDTAGDDGDGVVHWRRDRPTGANTVVSSIEAALEAESDAEPESESASDADAEPESESEPDAEPESDGETNETDQSTIDVE